MLDECQTKGNQWKIHECSMEETKTKNCIKLEKLPYDENSQDVTLVNKTPLIGKVNNSKLGIINNERYIIK